MVTLTFLTLTNQKGCYIFLFCCTFLCSSLGKTIQVIGFLSGMFDAEKIKAVLIVLPVAVIINWEREFEKWSVTLIIKLCVLCITRRFNTSL